MNTKRMSAVLCVALVLSAGAAVYVLHDTDESAKGPPWMMSSIFGMLPDAAPDMRDDFYLAVNYDHLSGMRPMYHNSFFDDAYYHAMVDIESLFSGEASSHEQKLLQELYAAYCDEDLRDRTGYDDLMPLIEGLMSAEDLGDITEYLTGGSVMIINPLMSINIWDLQENIRERTVVVFPPPLTLSDPRNYLGGDPDPQMERMMSMYRTHLMLLGYTEAEADAMNRAATALETEIARGILSVAEGDGSIEIPYDVLEGMSFPIADILSSKGYQKDEYLIDNAGWLGAMERIYVEENFEGLRGFLLRMTLSAASQYMGGQFLQAYLDAHGVDLDALIWSYLNPEGNLRRELMSAAYYAKFHPDREILDAIESLFDSLKDSAYRHLDRSSWMSDDLKAAMKERLEDLALVTGGPFPFDFSGLVLPSAVGEGGPLGDHIVTWAFMESNISSMAGRPPDRVNPGMHYSFDASAHVFPDSNIIVLPAAVVNAVSETFQAPGAVMGMIGFLMGHEIMHLMNPSAIQFYVGEDSDSLLEGSDTEMFRSMASAYSDYLSQLPLRPGIYTDGDAVLVEALADLNGMSLLMDIAHEIDGFDHDTFFRAMAHTFHEMASEEFLELNPDYRYLYGCYRVNVVLQQFREFYDTYGIEKGDGMYLDPKDRHSVW